MNLTAPANNLMATAPTIQPAQTAMFAKPTDSSFASYEASQGFPQNPVVSTPITNPVPAPSGSTNGVTPPPLPQPTAPSVHEAYATSATADAAAARTALQSSYDKQIASIGTQKDQAQANIDTITGQQKDNLANIEALTQPWRDTLETAQRDTLHVNTNFEENQKLTDELDSLLQQGNDLIKQQKGQAIASSILNKQVTSTMSDVAARAGVIQAVMAARNSQISVAETMIDRSVAAITADKNDQLSYYKTLGDFYQNQKDDAGKKLDLLTADQKQYINAKITSLQDDVKRTQANADSIKAAMQDPATAQAYGQAGVTLNDAPEQINKKLSDYAYSKELATTSNDMAKQGYSAVLPGQKTPAGNLISVTDSQGKVHQYVNPKVAAGSGGGSITSLTPAGQAWVTNILNGNATMANVPAGLKNEVSVGLTTQPADSYSPLAASRFTTAANRIVGNFLKLPAYELTANGLPYLQRIDAAMKTPGSVSDQDLLDSLTKLNTAGNAVTDAQIKVITGGSSFADMAGTFANKFKNGGVLSDNQRQQIQTIAQAIYANYAKGYQPVFDQATKQLKAAGIPEAFWTIPDLNNLSGQQGGSSAPADTSTIQNDIQFAIKDTQNFPTREALISALVQHYGISQDEAAKKVYATWTDNTKR